MPRLNLNVDSNVGPSASPNIAVVIGRFQPFHNAHRALLQQALDVAPPVVALVGHLWRMLRDYKNAWRATPHPPVLVTVDAVVRCTGHVLLIQRGQAPGRGLYAVPGGFIEQRETACQSALRELAEETQLKLLRDTMRRSLRATAVFDHPDRSLRGRTITHAHYFDLGSRELPEVRADDDAESVEWMLIAQLAAQEDRFHDDHFHMLDHFLGLTAQRGADAP